MRRKPSYTTLVERRISSIQREVDYNTQQLRKRTMVSLETLFTLASSIAKGEPVERKIGENEQPINLQQRQMWGHVAAHAALAMGNLAKGFDERQFNEDLAKLERLVDEIDDFQTQHGGKEVRAEEDKTGSSGTGSESVSDSR